MTLHITGITDLHRADSDGRDTSQEIIVRERDDTIHLSLTHGSYGARMTIDQAKALSVLLHVAADRVAQRLQETKNV